MHVLASVDEKTYVPSTDLRMGDHPAAAGWVFTLPATMMKRQDGRGLWILYGGAVFYTNNWPPLPAKLTVDDRTHPVTRQLPVTYAAPANEWYLWKPSPRSNKNVHVLVTLDPSNYPNGVKDVITGGDLPVVWTNTKYRMIYMNMGHGEKIYSDATQNMLFANAILWLGTQK